MSKKETTAEITKWQEIHSFLSTEEKNERKQKIEEHAGWSQATFYKKMKSTTLSQMEKETIAKIYNLPLNFLF